MIVLVGPSASGKTELAKLLFHEFKYKKCITSTTRKPRINEVHDVDYHFLTFHEFLDIKTHGGFLEVSKYHHNYYGFQKNDVMYKGVVVLDPNGANAVVDAKIKDTFIVFVKSDEHIRKARMIERGDDLKTIESRLIDDQEVFQLSHMKHIDLIIENNQDNLIKLAKTIHLAYMAKMHQK